MNPGPEELIIPPACPACAARRLHSAEDLRLYHPYAGHGWNGSSWTHPDLEPVKPHDQDFAI